MNTDQDWILWGERDPYFAVITQPRFRAGALTPQARAEFFDSGRWHAEHVLASCRRVAGSVFEPRRALDFGCGVGRVALPLARHVQHVTGVDVSPAMLAEARRNADAQGIANVDWRLSDDTLSAVHGRFDLIHSCITFQHIDIPRGRALFARLLALLAPRGVAALQITYAKSAHADAYGQPPRAPEAPVQKAGYRGFVGRRAGVAESHTPPVGADPSMQMNAYHLGELAWMMQSSGVSGFHAEFTDHGGELGVFLFFAAPAEAISPTQGPATSDGLQEG